MAPDRNPNRLRAGRKQLRLDPERHAQQQGEGGDGMGETVRKAERIELVAAIEHRICQARAAEEHTDHGATADAIAERDQLACDDVVADPSMDDLEYPLERDQRIAGGAKVKRDE